MARDTARMLDPVLMAQDCGITPDEWQADVLRSSERRQLLLCARQSGKTTTTAIKGLHRAIYTTAALVVIVSPSQRQSAEMLRTLKGLHAQLDGAPKLVSESVLKIEFEHKSRILALPGTEKTIRGLAGVDLVIIDEAARVDDELLAAVRPMLATKRDGELIALTTPAGKRGWFYDAWHGKSGTHWSRVRVSARDNPRISQEFLDEELRNYGAMRFAEEYELAFIDADESAFPSTVIESAFTNELRPLWA